MALRGKAKLFTASGVDFYRGGQHRGFLAPGSECAVVEDVAELGVVIDTGMTQDGGDGRATVRREDIDMGRAEIRGG